MTPNKYEETTDNDNDYKYSMYTETIAGRGSDVRSKATRSRKDGGARDYLTSVGTTIVHNAGQLTSQGVTGESPEREIFQAEGTAIFASNQLRQYASQSSGERRVTERMSSTGAVRIRSSDLMKPDSERQDQQQYQSGKPLHIHSDSIMSAQFQPENVHQMFSQENLHRQDQPRLVQTRPEGQQVFSEKDRYEDERAGAIQRRPSAGLRSPGSFDRKTFTLGDKAGHPGLNSKTDVLSLPPYNHLTSPTEQLAQSKPNFNPVEHLQ